jgi:alkylation response protein AidB-like acyl-CoA dehydrogenase
MQFELDDWQETARRSLRKYLDAEVAPLVEDYEDAHRLPPPEVLQKIGEFGLLGGLLPEEQGGAGLDYLTYCTLLCELSQVWPSLRSIVSTSNLVLMIVAQHGTPEQQERWLGDLVSGRKTAFFALTEPNVGSDASNVETCARRDGDGWRLNGRKLYISNGTGADLGVVFARSGEGEDAGVSAFLVEAGTPGFSSREVRSMGMNSCPLGELLFEDVSLPADHLIGDEGKAFAIAKHYLNVGRCFVSFTCLGVSIAAYEAALRYAGEREQFGRKIGGFQLVQEMIADMMTGVEMSRLLACRAADALDRDAPDRSRACSMAKRHNSDTALRVCETALQVHGGAGYTRDFPVERYYRDVRHLTIAEGTNQLQALLLAQGALGISALRG